MSENVWDTFKNFQLDRPKRKRETKAEKEFRKEMEMLGFLTWMCVEKDLLTQAVKQTGQFFRETLEIAAGLHNETDTTN